jgi:hypothetical protein
VIFDRIDQSDEARGMAKLMAAVRNVVQSHILDRLPFALYVRNDNRAARLVKLIATCGPLDMDKPEPAITVMMPDED